MEEGIAFFTRINFSVNVVLSVLLLLILTAVYWSLTEIAAYRKKLPPMCPSSMLENITTVLHQDLRTLDNTLKLSKLMTEWKKDKSSGVTYRYSLPQWHPFIFTTDSKLSKILFSGKLEAEKSKLMETFNLLDRDVNSILSHPNKSEDRERARKAIAPSFSTSNLQLSWSDLRFLLSEQSDSLSQLACSGQPFDFRPMCWQMFLASLAMSGLGVKITFDGKEDDSSVDGLKFMEESDIALRERAREMFVPFRTWQFWDPAVRRGAEACRYLKSTAAKIASIHRSNEQEVTMRKRSIIDHLMPHNYPSENARLTDLWVLIQGGHETTASTFSFFMMEIARNPSVQHKLRSILASFMPEHLSLSSTVDLTQSEGDSKLLSTIANCEYLNNCLKETMRLWPVLAGGPMRDIVEDLHYEGMLLPAGSTVCVHYYSLFRSEWIENADQFDPDRWLASNPQLPQLKEMFTPFSLGKRACVGQNMAMFQMRIIAAHFVRYFDFELVEEPTFEYFFTLKPRSIVMKVKAAE